MKTIISISLDVDLWKEMKPKINGLSQFVDRKLREEKDKQ